MSRILGVVAITFIALVVPVGATAQTAAIAGIVKDTTGAVLPGVTVEASSPALIEKVRAVTTDGIGQYRIVDLRPGVYTVSFALPGFATVIRQGIELTAGFTANVTVELRVGEVAETVTVSGASPVVDVQNVTQQRNMTREVLDVIPSGKQVTSLAALIPGVITAGATGSINQDVGGATGMSFATVAIHGGRQGDQAITINGMSVASMSAFDNSRTNLQDGNVEEFTVQLAAAPAEFASGGVSVNAVPKEGGNTFRGAFFGGATHESWQSDNFDADLKQRGLSTANRIKRLVDISPSFGGPIAKERLWFYASFRYLVTESYVGGLFYNKDPKAWVYTPDLNRPAINAQNGKNGSLNFTWQASRKHKLTGFYNYEFQCNCHFGISPSISPEASRNMRPNSRVYQGTWTYPATNRLLLEAGLSHYPVGFPRDPQEDATEPALVEQATGFSFRSATTYVRNDQRLDNYRASLSYVTGTHALKFGFSYIRAHEPDLTWSIGDVSYRTLNGVPNQVTYRTTPYTNDMHIDPLALFVQDQWTLKRWTINAGVRIERLRAYYSEAQVPPVRWLPVAREYPGAEVLDWKDVNPRLGVSWDLFGSGKTAVKATLNRYVLQEGRNTLVNVHPVIASTNTLSRTWTDTNGDFNVQGDPLTPTANSELGPSPNTNFGKPTLSFRFAPDWATGFGTRAYNWETSVAIQHEVLPRISVSAAYFRRIYGNFTVTDNLLVSPSDYDPYCIMAPVDSRLPNGGGDRVCGLFDLKPEAIGRVDMIRTISGDYGKQQEHWDGVDLTMNARFGRDFLLQGGMSTGKTMTDNCDVVTKIDDPSTRFCHSESKLQTQVKFLGSYLLPAGFQVSATYQSMLPDPTNAFFYNAMGMPANYVATNAVVRPSLGRNLSAGANATATINLIEPGTLYGDRLHQIDVRLAKLFTIGNTRLKALADLYNMFNANPIFRYNASYGTTGDSWLVPQEILPGRLFKIGAQVTF
jgi:hypothetical protein